MIKNINAPIIIATTQLFSVRYLLGTDILKTLNNDGRTIIILNPNAENKEFQNMFSGNNIVFEQFRYDSYKKIRKSKLYNFFVQVRWLTLPRDQHIETIKFHEFEYGLKKSNVSFIGCLFISMVIFISRILRASSFLRRIFFWLENSLIKTTAHQIVFDTYKPSIVVTADIGTNYITSLLIGESKRNNVEVLPVILSWDNLTSKGVTNRLANNFIVWNNTMKDELMTYHSVNEKSITVGGIAHFKHYFIQNLSSRKTFCENMGLRSDSKILFFGTASPLIFPNYLELIILILEAIKKGVIKEKTQLLVRFHPAFFSKYKETSNSLRKSIEHLQTIYGDSLVINWPLISEQEVGAIQAKEEQQMLSEILFHSDLMVSIYSTLIIEACICDLPIINVGFFSYRNTSLKNNIYERFTHIDKLNKYNAMSIANSEEELIEQINAYMADKTLLKEGRMKLTEIESGPNKGFAGEFIGKEILSLANKL